MAESFVAKMVTPGNSRIRDCERWIRENGFVVLPADWDSSFVQKKLSRILGPFAEVRDVKQARLEISGPTHVHTLVVDWKGVDVPPQ